MRILIIYFVKNSDKKSMDIVKKLEQTAVSCGHQVDIKTGLTDYEELHLPGYGYIAAVVKPASFFKARLPEQFAEAFSLGGSSQGKRGAAIIIKKGLASNKVCRQTMRAMEKEGIMLDYSEIISSVDQASYAGKKLG